MYRARGHRDFEFLREQLDKSAPFAPQAGYQMGVDVFVHQERLAEDATELFKKLGAKIPGNVEAFNVTGEKMEPDKYREFYTPELIDLVYKMNKPYFDRFPEYSFEGIAPTGLHIEKTAKFPAAA